MLIILVWDGVAAMDNLEPVNSGFLVVILVALLVSQVANLVSPFLEDKVANLDVSPVHQVANLDFSPVHQVANKDFSLVHQVANQVSSLEHQVANQVFPVQELSNQVFLVQGLANNQVQELANKCQKIMIPRKVIIKHLCTNFQLIINFHARNRVYNYVYFLTLHRLCKSYLNVGLIDHLYLLSPLR